MVGSSHLSPHTQQEHPDPISIEDAALQQESLLVSGGTLVTFKLSALTLFGEFVAVVGSCPELGNWQPSQAFLLDTTPESYPNWKASIALPTGESIEYKYIILRGEPIQHGPVTTYGTPYRLIRWEATNENRFITPQGVEMSVLDGSFGDQSNQNLWVDEGWLQGDYQLILQVESKAVTIRHQSSRFQVELNPVEPSRLPVPYLCDANLCLEEDSYFVYTAPTFQDLSVSILVWSLNDEQTEYDKPRKQWAGKVTLLASQLITKQGKVVAPILDGDRVIGEFSARFLVITPLIHPQNNIAVINRNDWNNAGAGKFRKHLSLGVQLTKDLVPVLYDELTMDLPVTVPSNFEVPVSFVTYEQFTELNRKIETRVPDIKLTEINGSVTSPEDFTTLREALEKSPQDIAFNVELKYSDSSSVEKNLFVEEILKIVFEFAGNRPLFLSSFDAEICLMLARKQPRYPVFVLVGTEDRIRICPSAIGSAVKFARMARLRGILAECSVILEDLSSVGLVKDANLLLVSFGKENQDPEKCSRQKEAGVDAIISHEMSNLTLSNPFSIGISPRKNMSKEFIFASSS